MHRLHAPALAVASIAAVAALAACSSSGGGSGSTSAADASAVATPTVTTTAPAPVTTSPATSSAPSGGSASTSGTSGTGSSSAGSSACAESQLRASASTESVPGINRHVVRLVFANISTSSCTLTGYPGAAIVDSSGKQVQQAKRVVGGPVAGTVERVATLTVRPGASVFAYLEGQSTKEQGAAQAGCDGPKYPRILVTPPNTRTAVPFTIGWPQCYAFDVHPVREQ